MMLHVTGRALSLLSNLLIISNKDYEVAAERYITNTCAAAQYNASCCAQRNRTTTCASVRAEASQVAGPVLLDINV